MNEILNASIPSLLVIAGLICIVLAIIGSISGKIEIIVPKKRQLILGGVGIIFLVIGLVLGTPPLDDSIKPTPSPSLTPSLSPSPSPSPSPTQTPTPNKVYLVPQLSNASFCNNVEVQIWANTTDTFGSSQINLTYSHCCGNVTNLEYGPLWQGTWDSRIDGREWLVFIRPLGQPTINGTVLIGNLTIHCCNESKRGTPLTFSSPSKLSDPIAGNLTVTWIDGAFDCIRQVCGDVNCDDTVDISDIVKLRYYVSDPGNPNYTICSEWAADVNCDHSINESDYAKLFNYTAFGDSTYTLNCCE